MSEIDFSDDQNDASVIHELTRLADANVPATDVQFKDGRRWIVHRDDFHFKEVTLPHSAEVLQPKWVTQAATMQTAASLRDYVKRFKNDGTLLFADIKNNTIVGAIDYHREPDNAKGHVCSADPSPRLGTHNATLKLDFSKEWTTWTKANESLMGHAAFADFLEENAIDVCDPSGASLLELCRDLHVRQGMEFKSAIRMGDRVSVEYQKENDATTKAGMQLPVEFTLDIPVYFGETSVTVRCLMRRKIDDGDLYLGYKMVRAENIRQEEFQRIVEAVSVDTDTLALYGAK